MLIFFAKLGFSEKDIILNLRKKMIDLIKDYQKFRDFSLSKSTVSLVYFDYLRKKKLPYFQIDNFLENMLINSLFPGYFFYYYFHTISKLDFSTNLLVQFTYHMTRSPKSFQARNTK